MPYFFFLFQYTDGYFNMSCLVLQIYCSGSKEDVFEGGADCLSVVISERPNISSEKPLEEVGY